MKENISSTPRYLSCQCIRQIIGPVYGSLININLSGRLVQLVSQAFEIDQVEVVEIIANYYLKKNKKIDPDDFSDLVQVLYDKKHPSVALEGEMGAAALAIITVFTKNGWGIHEFNEMYETGIAHVQKKKGDS